jgi:two-component sensor histidine kinase
MYKSIILSIALFLSAIRLAAQYPPAQTPKELLLAIQKSKPDTNRISLQLKLGNYYLYKPASNPAKPAEHKHNLDSAINFFNQALHLSISLHETDWQYVALDMILGYDWQIPEHSKQISIWAVNYDHQKGNMSKEADALERLAGTSFKMDKFKDNVLDRIGYYQHARSLYLQNHELLKAAGDLSNIAHLRILIKQFYLADKDLQQSLAEYRALGYKKLHYTYSMLVDLEYTRGNYYRAIAYCLQGIKHTVAGENKIVTSRFYWYAAKCNYEVKKYNEALIWSRKAAEINVTPCAYRYFPVETFLELNKTEEAHQALDRIEEKGCPITWITLNHYKCLAVYHAKKNNTGLAVQYYLKTLEIARKCYASISSAWNLLCDNGIAAAYLKAAQAAKAKKYINDATLNVENTKTQIAPDVLVNLYDNSYKYDLATGNYRSAVKNLERRVKIQDSLFTADKDKQLAELNIQYQTAQQEQSIKTLHSQGTAQQAKLKTASLQRNVTIGGIVLVLVIAGLLYRQNRLKQKNNDIITHKNGVITHKNGLLQNLVEEKEWLLKEVHHRVKNNLHTVICLLESQASYLENDALEAIEKSQHRIYTMSLIHQKLYQSEDVKTINLATYVPELVQYLSDSFDISNQIYFNLMIEPISLNASQAIPLALLINEALTNSIKYAFPDHRRGEITISLTDTGEQYKLAMADNGVGMLQEAKKDIASLGMDLMKGLAKEIRGSIDVENNNGVKITVVFERDALNDMDRLVKSIETDRIQGSTIAVAPVQVNLFPPIALFL